MTQPHHQKHWHAMQHHIVHHHRVKSKFENPHIVGSWAKKIGHHDYIYCVHIKTGHFMNHHHFTVIYQIKDGFYKLLDIHQGHKTIW